MAKSNRHVRRGGHFKAKGDQRSILIMRVGSPLDPTDRRDWGRHHRSRGTRWLEWSPLTATARQAQSVRLCHRYRTPADCQIAFDFGAKEFVDLEKDGLEGVGGPDPAFDVIGGDIQMRSAGVLVPEERW